MEGAAGPEDTGITDNIKDKMSKLASELSKSRKKREIPPTLASEVFFFSTISSVAKRSFVPMTRRYVFLCVCGDITLIGAAAATAAAVATAAGVAGGSVRLQREEHASCAPRQRNSVCGPASEQG